MHVQERAAVTDWRNSVHLRLDKQHHDTAAEACQRYVHNANLLALLCGADIPDTDAEAEHLAGRYVMLCLSASASPCSCCACATVTAVYALAQRLAWLIGQSCPGMLFKMVGLSSFLNAGAVSK